MKSSLAYTTDLWFAQYEGEVNDRGSYSVILTPSNPGYWWGNFILFENAPQEGDAPIWLEMFEREVGKPPKVKHIALGWKAQEEGFVQAFLDKGLRFDKSIVLTAQTVNKPPKVNKEAIFRLLETEDDWRQVLELQVLCREESFVEAPYRLFRERALKRYQNMIADGMGNWFGAFLNGKLVADLGLFYKGTIGRFQHVETHPEYRRRGLCGTLVHWAASYGFKHYGVKTLVMVADPEYHAARIYESVGFKPTEYQYGLERPSKDDYEGG